MDKSAETQEIFPIAISSGNPYNKNVQSQGKEEKAEKLSMC